MRDKDRASQQVMTWWEDNEGVKIYEQRSGDRV